MSLFILLCTIRAQLTEEQKQNIKFENRENSDIPAWAYTAVYSAEIFYNTMTNDNIKFDVNKFYTDLYEYMGNHTNSGGWIEECHDTKTKNYYNINCVANYLKKVHYNFTATKRNKIINVSVDDFTYYDNINTTEKMEAAFNEYPTLLTNIKYLNMFKRSAMYEALDDNCYSESSYNGYLRRYGQDAADSYKATACAEMYYLNTVKYDLFNKREQFLNNSELLNIFDKTYGIDENGNLTYDKFELSTFVYNYFHKCGVDENYYDSYRILYNNFIPTSSALLVGYSDKNIPVLGYMNSDKDALYFKFLKDSGPNEKMNCNVYSCNLNKCNIKDKESYGYDFDDYNKENPSWYIHAPYAEYDLFSINASGVHLQLIEPFYYYHTSHPIQNTMVYLSSLPNVEDYEEFQEYGTLEGFNPITDKYVYKNIYGYVDGFRASSDCYGLNFSLSITETEEQQTETSETEQTQQTETQQTPQSETEEQQTETSNTDKTQQTETETQQTESGASSSSEYETETQQSETEQTQQSESGASRSSEYDTEQTQQSEIQTEENDVNKSVSNQNKSEIDKNNRDNQNTIIIGASCGGVGLIGITAAAVYYIRRKDISDESEIEADVEGEQDQRAKINLNDFVTDEIEV